MEYEVPRLPPSEVLAALGQITLLVASLDDRLLRLAYDVRREERDGLDLLLDWKRNQGPEVCLEGGL